MMSVEDIATWAVLKNVQGKLSIIYGRKALPNYEQRLLGRAIGSISQEIKYLEDKEWKEKKKHGKTNNEN